MKTLGGKTPANNSDSLVDNSSDNGAACGNNNGFFTANEKIDFSNVKVEPLFEEEVDFDTFSKSDFRAVKVKECVAVPKSKKLLQFTLDDGTGTDRTILSGIHAYYEPEAMIKVRVGYGNPTDVLPKLAESYQEAKMALEVGRLFYVEKEIMAYDRLGIGRLIYQLPMSLCEMFIREVFGDEVPQILDDEEAMSTISKFFENNLNISETARQLYVHRNTLVYRLERIEKAIGLDIRTFDDAMIFKIATMVLAHIKDSRQGR